MHITRRTFLEVSGTAAFVALPGSTACRNRSIAHSTPRPAWTSSGTARPSGKGQPENFTGTVRINPLQEAAEPSRLYASSVTFEPRAHELRGTPIRWARH